MPAEQFSIDDTHPEYTMLGAYKFPKGSTAERLTDIFVIDKEGNLQPSDHWSFSIPGYMGVLGVLDADFDVSAKRVHDMLKTKGWIK